MGVSCSSLKRTLTFLIVQYLHAKVINFLIECNTVRNYMNKYNSIFDNLYECFLIKVRSHLRPERERT